MPASLIFVGLLPGASTVMVSPSETAMTLPTISLAQRPADKKKPERTSSHLVDARDIH